jgi:opacity protein-like surface antigen
VSREQADPLNTASPNPGGSFWGPGNYSGSTSINVIQSDIGRAGVRVGTTVEMSNLVLQPFLAASVWHDFAGDITAHYASCPNCIFVGGAPAALTANMTTNNVGTFGQYSVGIAGQVVNTGWLGFVRMDYREGPQMVGLSGTGGIRYQFLPTDAPAAVMPVKAPVYKAPVETISWTGLYVGAIGGADVGRGFIGSANLFGSDIRTAGALGGGTLGYNYQLGKLVFGVEADAAWTNASGSNQCTGLTANLVAPTPLFQMTCHDGMNWIATATARLGYALAPHTLVYAKVGGAWAEATYSETCNLGPLFNNNIPGNPVQNCFGANPAVGAISQTSASTTLVGWTVGYGAEFAFNSHWSAKGEIDWIDFGNKQLTLSDGSAVNTSQRVAQGKVGLNYKF